MQLILMSFFSKETVGPAGNDVNIYKLADNIVF